MSFYDYRTVSDDQVSFYVFDDLRYQQNRRGDFNIYHYDTLEEAVAKYRELDATMTTALGLHSSSIGEFDLLHRREGENVLVTDYLTSSRWRTNPDVLHAVSTLCDTFKIEWQSDRRCLDKTILIPLERGFERIPDRAFLDKSLRPATPTSYMSRPSVLTSINECYAEGRGWTSFHSLYSLIDRYGWESPHCVKIQRFNVNYTDSRGHTGQADVSPLDMQILMERHILQHGDDEAVKRATKRLAEEISELVVVPGPDQAKYAATLCEELIKGNTHSAVEALKTMQSFGDTDHEIAEACRLLARVHSIEERERQALPDLCYTVLKATGDLVCVKKGVEGYFSTSYNTKNTAHNQELADYMNERLGVTAAQVMAMEFGSRFGWTTPGSDPRTYDHPTLAAQIDSAESRKPDSACAAKEKEQTRE